MRVAIIYDNTVFQKELQSDWGFAALVETHNRKILFDTGASGSILLGNMQKLGIDPEAVDDVFISHAHYDHVGGLSSFLDRNNDLAVWAPASFRGVKNAREVVHIQEGRELYPGIYSTGELEGIEQSMCVETEKGIVVIAGCSHPNMRNILDAAAQFGEVHGIIGGFHGNGPEALQGLDMICATHCTQQIAAIKATYPDQFIEGGAGKVIEI